MSGRISIISDSDEAEIQVGDFDYFHIANIDLYLLSISVSFRIKTLFVYSSEVSELRVVIDHCIIFNSYIDSSKLLIKRNLVSGVDVIFAYSTITMLPFASMNALSPVSWPNLSLLLMNGARLLGNVNLASALIGKYAHVSGVLSCVTCVYSALETDISFNADVVATSLDPVDESSIHQNYRYGMSLAEYREQQHRDVYVDYNGSGKTLSFDDDEYSLPSGFPVQQKGKDSICDLENSAGGRVLLLQKCQFGFSDMKINTEVVRIDSSVFISDVFVVGNAFITETTFQNNVTITGNSTLSRCIFHNFLKVYDGTLYKLFSSCPSLHLIDANVFVGQVHHIMVCQGFCILNNVLFLETSSITVLEGSTVVLDDGCFADTPISLLMEANSVLNSTNSIQFVASLHATSVINSDIFVQPTFQSGESYTVQENRENSVLQKCDI
ncbi:hypothetical protein PCE1_004523 [Barthelona sp. PCE]